MKIVQINETCGTGSIGRMTAELAYAYRDYGHESYVFFASGTPTYDKSIRIGNRMAQIVHALHSRLTGKQGYASVLSTYQLLRTLDRIQPDIVHLQNLHSNYVNLGMLLRYLARKNIATVITLHDCWFFTGKCTFFVPVNCQKWKNGCGKCPLLHFDNVNPTLFFDRTAKCLSDKEKWFAAIPRLGVVGVSNWVTGNAKASIFSGNDPETIYNWVDTDVFMPREPLRSIGTHNIQGKFIVLMVAMGISEKKGYLVLKELAQRLPQEYQIILVGKNTDNLEIPQNVIHIERTNDAVELSQYYSTADVCVNTTKYETFGLVTAEALSCGTPVIVYNNTASPELVGPGCGYAVEETSGIDAVIEAIHKIKAVGKRNMSADCRKFVQTHFNKKAAEEQYLSLYERLLSSETTSKRDT